METGTIEAPAPAGESSAPTEASVQPDLPGVNGGAIAPAPAQGAADPFEADEASLAALSPESRTAVEPMLKAWKEKASETLKKETSSRAELEKQAKAFQTLTSNPQFQQWYRSLSQPAQPTKTAATPEPKGTQHVTPEEWVAAANDPAKFSELQKRQAKAVLEESLGRELKELQQFRYETQIENQFRAAKEKYKDINDREYDSPEIGLLEPLVWYWADFKGKEGGNVEQAFGHIKKIEDYFEKKYQAKYNQMVQQKKAGTTEVPAPSAAGAPDTIYAKGKDSALRETIRAALSGRNVNVVNKK